jgi:D-alanine--poly(phosphoribitol) ligase subunit 1
VPPRFSVIVPTFNRPRLLARAVTSVLAQQFEDFELLIVDDGSDDLYASGWAGSDDRIRVLRTASNSGAGAARNLGLEVADGDYVVFLDDDDEFAPTFLATMSGTFAGPAEAPVLSWCGVRFVSDVEVSAAAVHRVREFRATYPEPSALHEELMSIGTGFGVSMQTRCLREIGGFDRELRTVEDADLFLRVLARGYSVAATPGVHVTVHDHGGTRMTGAQLHAIRIQECELLLRRHADFLSAQPTLRAQIRLQVKNLRRELSLATPHLDMRASGPRLDEYVDANAAKDPERPAVEVGDARWSYAELRRAKGAVAQLLDDGTATPTSPLVGVACRKGLAAYAALLGASESGSAYLPLDGSLPDSRLRTILELTRPAVVLVDRGDEGRWQSLGTNAIPLDAGALLASERRERSSRTPRRSEAAYVLFTSGSTGTPKGVAVTHANARACIDAVSERFPLDARDRVSQLAALSFDFSVGEMFLGWAAGACLCVPLDHERIAPSSFLNRTALTVWMSVPTIAANLLALGGLRPGAFPSLRWSFFCGEALPTPLAAAWQAAAPNARVVNLYGPTEASVFATAYVLDPSAPLECDIVPIGMPLRGFEWRISGGDDKAAAGELMLAGPQVVAGYWHDPVATRRAFIADDELAERTWYRTGDLVTYESKYGLRFHGRVDRQVKVRGHRVELQEIEAVVRAVTGAANVAVVPLDLRHGSCDDVIAYCDRLERSEHDVVRACRDLLPRHMVPRRVIQLAELPRNSNGKIDYGRLEAPEGRG